MGLKRCISISRIIFICFVFILCSAFSYREPNYIKMVDRISKVFLKECALPRGLILSGYGGAMMSDIESVTLRFLSYDSLNVDEARVLYVDMMEEYLQRINCHQKIRSYLHNFPFSIDNIKLNISFINSEARTKRDGHVAMVFIGRNHTIYYDAYDPIKKFYTLHRETYEEALKIVREGAK